MNYYQFDLFGDGQNFFPENEKPLFKVCTQCGEEKHDSQFIRKDGMQRATRNRCKACWAKAERIVKRLKLENPVPKEGPCPICGTHTKKWVLDHCHVKSTFRGYLCSNCNTGIGMLKDNPVLLERASRYLIDS